MKYKHCVETKGKFKLSWQWSPFQLDPNYFYFHYWLYYNDILDAEEYLESVVKIHWPNHQFDITELKYGNSMKQKILVRILRDDISDNLEIRASTYYDGTIRVYRLFCPVGTKLSIMLKIARYAKLQLKGYLCEN